jgi:Secretion system C-terminal sorting domain/SprB repeat
MMKNFKLFIFFLASNFIFSSAIAQANPFISVLPLNSGLVNLNSTLDLQITIGNTGTANIPASKLRPVISVPSIVNILADGLQTGLPVGWSIVSNSGSQIRICNGADVIAGNASRIIIIKVQAVSVGGPLTFSGQLNFGGATCASAGAAPSGNNIADDNATSTITVVAGCSLAVNATAGNILCNAGTTIITASSSGIASPVEYALSGTNPFPFQTSNIFNVSAGSYTVTVRDIANPLTCVALSSTIVIEEPLPFLAPTINITQPTCTNASGLVSLTSSTTGLSFSIDGNTAYTPYIGAIALTSGPHTIRAKNSNGCLSPINNFVINAQPSTPSTPVIGTITQPNCSISTGSVILSGLPSGNWVINPGAIVGNGSSTNINSLAATVYNFTVTNDAGCTSTPSANVNINAVVGAPATPTTFVTQPTCTVSTGSVLITTATTGLTFSLDGGAYVAYPASGFVGIAAGNHSIIAQNVSGCLSPLSNFIINPQPTAPAAPTIDVTQPTCTIATGKIIVLSPVTGLTFSFDGGPFTTYPTGGFIANAGSHSLAAQNGNACSPTTINNIIVNVQPATPVVNITASPISCFGDNTTITATGIGGVLPYQFSLNNTAFQPSNTFVTPAGNYNIAIKDLNGCVGLSNNLSIVQPTQILASLAANNIACNGGNALLTVVASGGTGAFEYSINNGATYQTGNTFNVLAGSYSAKVRLAVNPSCSTSTANLIIAQPDLLKASSTAAAINSCGGTTEIKVEGVGGKQPYTGIGKFTRGPGTWRFLVTDNNGCTATTEIKIFPPGCVDIKVFPNPAQNLITINHSKAEQQSTVQIFNMYGALVMQKDIPQNSFITTMDVSKLSSAVYVLVFVSGNERKELKFVKNNIK